MLQTSSTSSYPRIFEEALTYCLDNEGYTYENVPGDPGGCTKYGLSLRFLKSIPMYEEMDCTGVKAITLGAAKKIYFDHFWGPSQLGQVTDPRVAIKIFDAYVNAGPGVIKLVQHLVNNYGAWELEVDGILGKQSAEALNSVNSTHFLEDFIEALEVHYKTLVQRNPKLEKFLNGWLNRAQKLPDLTVKPN